jgi:hypothetical protein
MNEKLFGVLFSAAFALIGEPIVSNNLPLPVEKTLERFEHDKVKAVTVRPGDAATIYEIELEQNGALSRRLFITVDGNVIGDTKTTAPSVAPSLSYIENDRPVVLKLSLDDLPEAARQTVAAEAAGREITDITREVVGGRAAYKVQFQEGEVKLKISEDGTVLSDSRTAAEKAHH